MKQHKFEALYKSEWETFRDYLDAREISLSSQKDVGGFTAEQFPKQYRRMCHYLAIAKERKYSLILIDQLNDLVLRGHQHLYSLKKTRTHQLIVFLIKEFPSLVRKEWKYLFISLVLLYFSGGVMASLTLVFPELIHSVFSQSQINQFEEMYDPEKRLIGRTRDSDTNLQMFGYYIAHNIGISFQVFASGLFLGLGTIFYLTYNGIVMGTVASHLGSAGFGSTFFPFVIGHASFELTAIVIAGAAGLKLGFSIISPGRYSRKDALKRAARTSVKLVYGVIIMLLIAAFIEAFWSSGTVVSNTVKYIIGSGLWILVIVYFMFSGRTHGS